MAAQDAFEGLRRCLLGLGSVGDVVKIHMRRKPPSSVEPAAEIVLDDAAAAWLTEPQDSYVLGMRVLVYVPAVDMEAAQKKMVKLIEDIAAFRLTQRSQSLDGADGVLSAQWGPMVVSDIQVDNKAVAQMSMSVVATVQLLP